MSSIAPRFEIEEVTGSGRFIALSGRALPYQGVGWGGTLRHKKTYYPGNPVASIQLFGPEQSDTTITGMWKDRFLSTSNIRTSGFPNLTDPSNIFVADMVAAFKSIRNSANRLRVQWGDEVRFGYMSEFIPDYDRPQDVRYTVSFIWESEPEQQVATPATSEPDDVTEPFLAAEDVASARPQSIVPSFATIARAATSAQRVNVGQVFDSVRAFQSSVSSTTEILNASRRISSAANVCRDTANDVGYQLNDGPYNYQTTSDGVLTVLGVESWRRSYNLTQNNFAVSTLRTAKTIQKQTSPTSIATVVCPEDTTLRGLSLRYYGNSDDWWLIADANGIVESVVRAGTVISIPPKTVVR